MIRQWMVQLCSAAFLNPVNDCRPIFDIFCHHLFFLAFTLFFVCLFPEIRHVL